MDDVAHMVEADDAVVIPQGTNHNVINTGSEDLKLYSIYYPIKHKGGTIDPTKPSEK